MSKQIPPLYALTPIDQTEGLIKVKQTKLHNPPVQNGNCFRAVISTITSIPIDEIPAIEEMMTDDAVQTEKHYGMRFQIFITVKMGRKNLQPQSCIKNSSPPNWPRWANEYEKD